MSSPWKILVVALLGVSRLAPAAPRSPAPAEQSDQEERQAAQRRRNYAENQRAVAAAFADLQQATTRSGPVLTAQLGHGRAVNSLSLSADGRLLLSGSDDRTARLWSVEGGRELRRFVGQQSNVTAAALSRDGTLVATGGGEDHVVRIWDAATGAQRLMLTGHRATIGALAFLSEGKELASVDWDDTLRLWDLTAGKETRKFEKSVSGLSAVFAPDGKTVITIDASNNVVLRDVATGEPTRRLQIKESSPAFAFSSDGTVAAIGGRQCDDHGANCRAKTWLWNMQSRALQPLPAAGDYLVRGLAISPDKKQLAIGSGVGVFGKCEGKCAVQIVDVPSGKEVWRQANFSADIQALTFTADGKALLAAGHDGVIRMFEVGSGRLQFTLGGDALAVAAVALSPDGKWLAVGTGNSADFNTPGLPLAVILWDLKAGREARRLEIFGSAVSSLAFSANSRFLAAGSRGDPDACASCAARLWEVETGRLVQRFPTDVRRGGFALSPDGKQVAGSAAGSEEYTIGMWDAQSGKLLRRMPFGEQWAFAFAPSGSLLASVGGAGDVTLRDARTGKEQRPLSNASADMRPCVSFAPDGKLVAAGATSLFSSAVWDVKSSKVVSRLDGHTRDVTDIRLSGGRLVPGGLVATASSDTTAILWAARTGKLWRVLAGHFGGVTAVAFSANDRLVITGSLDGTARLWDAATGRPLLQLVSFREGQWLVNSADDHFDSSSAECGSRCHFVDGDKVVSGAQSQRL